MNKSERSLIEAKMKDNYHWYLAHQDELVQKYNGKHLVLVNRTVADAYDTNKDAYLAGREKYGMGNFSLQKCSPGDADTTIHVRGLYFPNYART